ncbi:MAG TPA: hypothetical protein V6D06_13740 [Trichocoleus sp.]
MLFRTFEKGLKVKIQYPDYVSGETGVILSPELERDGKTTGYWLVQVIDTDIVVALLPDEWSLLS